MVTVPQWTYNGQIITEIDDMPEGTYGFIYKVIHTPSQKKYIGKKVLYFERNKRLGKRALEALREERAKKGIKGRVPLKQKVITESDWKDYYGSHLEIKRLLEKDGPMAFQKQILSYVKSKKELTYYECKELFINEVLERDNQYINDNILGKFFRKDFLNETN
jgi:hypothetical protein|tara:strand:+ start:34 stop:522 length:489 start_codon:yes stop_codon:yes gene_type:complete